MAGSWRQSIRGLGFGLILMVLSGCAAELAEGGPTAQAARTPAEQGAALFRRKCSACHTPVNPAEFPASEWPRLVEKYGRRAHLAPEERQLVLTYLLEVRGAGGN